MWRSTLGIGAVQLFSVTERARRNHLFLWKGVLFSFKNTFLRQKSKVLYQVIFCFGMEIPTFRNYVSLWTGSRFFLGKKIAKGKEKKEQIPLPSSPLDQRPVHRLQLCFRSRFIHFVLNLLQSLLVPQNDVKSFLYLNGYRWKNKLSRRLIEMETNRCFL